MALKRRNGDLEIVTKPAAELHEGQAELLRAFGVVEGDTVLELLVSTTLEPKGFHAYCEEAYKMLLPPDKRPDAKRKGRHDRKPGKQGIRPGQNNGTRP